MHGADNSPPENRGQPTGPDIQTAIEFLKKLRPGGPWMLIAFNPDNEKDSAAITVSSEGYVAAFVREHDGKKNIYYSLNPTRTPMTKKAAKTDIARIEYLHRDLDPKPGETPEAAKARYIAALENIEPKPTFIIDSGNGIQTLDKLAVPIELPEPVIVTNGAGVAKKAFTEETAKKIADVESRIKAMMEGMDGVAGTQNIDRILRLPGTTNLPTAAKKAKGRVACTTRLVKFSDTTCTLEDFPPASEGASAEAASPPPPPPLDWAKVAEHANWLTSLNDLPADFGRKGKMIVAHVGSLKDLSLDLTQAGLLAKPYSSWSDVSLALAAIFKGHGSFTREQIAAALMCNLACNHHVTKQAGDTEKRRAVERSLNNSHTPTTARTRQPGDPKWRECRDDGSTVPSVHNAMLAITAIGVECKHDTFHNAFLVGYKGDEVQHELQSLVGEVTDNAILMLRHKMSERLGLDFTDKHTRDAVNTLALEHCFDPVCDMLDEAEAAWDGKKRLPALAKDYFNCANTPLNRACLRKMMIALVHRARHPGCKFDNILTLEGPEGLGKSTAFRVIAGDENFSDQTILGKDEREVQETMAGVWIHESADLAGIRKADVDKVKAFASRQDDIARPAYGYYKLRQKRRGINVGTTNADTYLQSQTGNRRFWPVKVLAHINIEKLRADRLQLLGEAAACESAGEKLVIPENLWEAASDAQEGRRVADSWEDILADIPAIVTGGSFEIQIIDEVVVDPRTGEKEERVASRDLLTHVLRIPLGQQTAHHAMRVADAMRHLGWKRPEGKKKLTVNGKQERGYFRPVPSAGQAAQAAGSAQTGRGQESQTAARGSNGSQEGR